MLGGLSWFAVPWAFASCLGLSARALLNNVRFSWYNNPSLTSNVLAEFPNVPFPVVSDSVKRRARRAGSGRCSYGKGRRDFCSACRLVSEKPAFPCETG